MSRVTFSCIQIVKLESDTIVSQNSCAAHIQPDTEVSPPLITRHLVTLFDLSYERTADHIDSAHVQYDIRVANHYACTRVELNLER